MCRRQNIKELFREFYIHHPHLDLDEIIDYFALFGGLNKNLELDYFETFFNSVELFVRRNFKVLESYITPSYLLQSPYREILIGVANGDGKMYGAIKKARVSETIGEDIVSIMIDQGILWQEKSREPSTIKRKKSYRIQPKLRFIYPFYRFWFGFVEPFRKDLLQNNQEEFNRYFEAHYERLRSLIYEQLSSLLLVEMFKKTTPIISIGGYWDMENEFDIVAITNIKKIIIGECKYKERKVCKSELTKLKAKAMQSGISADYFALFAKQGFSNELRSNTPSDVLLFELDDLRQILESS